MKKHIKMNSNKQKVSELPNKSEILKKIRNEDNWNEKSFWEFMEEKATNGQDYRVIIP